MLSTTLTSFRFEMEKLAFRPASAKMKVEEHHSSEKDAKTWKKFEGNLRAKTFQQAVLEHGDSDPKLKRYVKNFGGYLRSKDIVAKVPSRSSSKTYTVKRLPSGRLACNCKNWQYKWSVRSGNCRHIDELRAGVDLEKTSSGSAFLRGVRIAHNFEKAKEKDQRGKMLLDSRRRNEI